MVDPISYAGSERGADSCGGRALCHVVAYVSSCVRTVAAVVCVVVAVVAYVFSCFRDVAAVACVRVVAVPCVASCCRVAVAAACVFCRCGCVRLRRW